MNVQYTQFEKKNYIFVLKTDKSNIYKNASNNEIDIKIQF